MREPTDYLQLPPSIVRRVKPLIMAAGRAKRMGPLNIPKAMVPVAGKPLIDWCLEMLRAVGFREAVLVLGHLWEKIVEYVGEGDRYGLSLEKVVIDLDLNPGKGQTLVRLIEMGVIGRKCVLVAFPDDLLIDPSVLATFISTHHLAREKMGIWGSVMAVRAVRLPYGRVEVGPGGLVTSFEEKPLLPIAASTGYYILEPEALELAKKAIPLDPRFPAEFETYLLPKLAEMGRLYCHLVPEWVWLPVNTWKDLEEAERFLTGSVSG